MGRRWLRRRVQLGQQAGASQAPPVTPPADKPYEPIETWGEFSPGQGFLIGRGDAGELSISGYALARYLNQTPGEQTFTDDLGAFLRRLRGH